MLVKFQSNLWINTDDIVIAFVERAAVNGPGSDRYNIKVKIRGEKRSRCVVQIGPCSSDREAVELLDSKLSILVPEWVDCP